MLLSKPLIFAAVTVDKLPLLPALLCHRRTDEKKGIAQLVVGCFDEVVRVSDIGGS